MRTASRSERPLYLPQLLLDVSAWMLDLPSGPLRSLADFPLSSECTSGGRGSLQSVKLQRPDRDTVCSHSVRDATANVEPIVYTPCPLGWSKSHLRSRSEEHTSEL